MEPMHALSSMPISFPGLFGDWEWNPDPKALDIGNGIYWYGILIALGVVLAVLFCSRQAKKYGITEDNVYDLVLWAIPTCIVGARLYYVIFYLDLYRTADGGFDWGKAVAVWDGGLAIYGAVIVAAIVLALYCRHKKIPFGAFADLGCMGLLIGQAVGRWGNFLNREAFGTETTLPWRMRVWTSATEYIEVHPTFLYESLWNLAGLLIIWRLIAPRRRFDGENTTFYFFWYGLGRFWIEGLRTDSLYLFDWTLLGQPIRVSQALSLLLALGGAAAWCWLRLIRRPDPAGLYVRRLAAAEAARAAERAETEAAPMPPEPTAPETDAAALEEDAGAAEDPDDAEAPEDRP